jgi:hypothetical protein
MVVALPGLGYPKITNERDSSAFFSAPGLLLKKSLQMQTTTPKPA